MADELSEKHRTFCEEYLIDLNGTQAAIRTGYAANSAAVESSRLLRNANIRAYIHELMQERSKITLIDANFVLEGLRETAQRCLQAKPVMVFNPVEKQMEQKQTEDGQGVWEFDSTGANRAFELIGKHLGIFEKDNKQKGNEINTEVLAALASKING